MPNSPRAGNADLVTVAVLIEGKRIPDKYLVREMEVVREINRIPYARLVIADGSAVEETFEASESNQFVPGKTVELKAGYHSKNETIFKGVIVRQTIRIAPDGNTFLVLTCNDRATKLTVARSSIQFTKKKDSEVIAELLRKAGLKGDVEATDEVHEHLIKHYASDWDYLVSRAEANGQVVIVHDDKISVRAPVFERAELVVNFGDTVADLDAELDAVSQLPKVTGRAWDPSSQDVVSGSSSEPSVNKQGNIDGKKLVEVLGLRDYELQTQTPVPRSGLTDWANAKLLKSRLSRIRGRVTFPGNAKPKPGQLLDLKGLGERFNGSAYISGVRQHVTPGEWHTEVGFGLTERWFSDEHRDIDAPPAAGLRPGVGGLQIAKIKQIHDDPEGQRRVKVVLPFVEGGDEGVWVRLASPYATNNAGIVFLPEVEDEVVLGFLNDDPAFAVVLGALHSSARPAPIQPDDKNTFKAIVTNSQMKITFDDVEKILKIETPGGHVVTLSDKDKTVTIVDSNRNKMEMSEGGVTLESPGNISVKADGSVTIEGQSGVTVKSPADVGIEGLNTSVKAEIALTAQGQASAELSATGETTVKGARVMIN